MSEATINDLGNKIIEAMEILQDFLGGPDKKYSMAGYDQIDYKHEVVATLMVVHAEMRLLVSRRNTYRVSDRDVKWVVNLLDFLRMVNLEITGRPLKKE